MPAGTSKYEFGERIGGGGMADVFHALIRGAEGFERKVAIKRIKRNISTDKGFAKLFVNEAKLAAKLTHPNVVQTIDFDRDETGCFYLVMELIEGVDLRELVQTGRVPVSAVVFIVSEVLRALDYAHEMVADGRPLTIVHRDISPHNIMLSWQGSVKVVDFGIAKAIEGSLVSRSGSLKGKVAYMSPEQVHGHVLDGRSDLFALGIVLHELLTGERLFVAHTEAATLSQVLTKPIPNPRALNDLVPADLDAVVMRLLARDRDQRFERARDALDALSACSLATSQGRNDLETVLSERFPGQGPTRVRHLSQPVIASHESGPMHVQQQAIPIGQASATAETMAATPKAIIPAPLLPKRTVTAMPVSPGAAPGLALPLSDSQITKPKARRVPLLLLLSLVVLSLGAFAFVILSGDSEEEPEAKVEVLAVRSGSVSEDAGGAGAGGADSDASIAVLDAAAAMAAASPKDASAAEPDVPDARGKTVEVKSSEQSPANHKKARLTLVVKPWAAIEIDGKEYGQTPQTIELSRGKHRIVLRNEGLDRVERFGLTLKAAQIKKINRDWTEN